MAAHGQPVVVDLLLIQLDLPARHPCVQQHEYAPVVQRKFQRRRREVFARGQVESAVAAPPQQAFHVDHGVVAPVDLRLHELHVVRVDRDVQLLADEVRPLAGDHFRPLPLFLQFVHVQQHAQRRVGLDPLAAVVRVVAFVHFGDVAKHAIRHVCGQLAFHRVREQAVKIGQRPVDDVAHGRDVDDERLRPLDHLALDDVRQLEVAVFVDFVEDSHVRVQAVQPLAVAGARLDAGAHGVVVYAVAQRPESRGQIAAGLDLLAAFVEHDARLLLRVCQQIDVRAALAVLACAVGGVAGQHGAFAVAGAHHDQRLAVPAQARLFVHPPV